MYDISPNLKLKKKDVSICIERVVSDYFKLLNYTE